MQYLGLALASKHVTLCQSLLLDPEHVVDLYVGPPEWARRIPTSLADMYWTYCSRLHMTILRGQKCFGYYRFYDQDSHAFALWLLTRKTPKRWIQAQFRHRALCPGVGCPMENGV
jgi:hypothetical protein